jgi:hypothetical protein
MQTVDLGVRDSLGCERGLGSTALIDRKEPPAFDPLGAQEAPRVERCKG